MNETGQVPSRTMIRAWLPVIAWLGIIIFESTDLLSSGHTEGLLYALATALFGHIDRHKFDIFHAILRKVGHFAGYGMLGLLVWRAKLVTRPTYRAVTRENSRRTFAREGTGSEVVLPSPWQWAAWAVGFTALVAALDEWHQTLLPSRTGTFHDVVLDTIGAVVFVVIARALWGNRGAGIRNQREQSR